MPTASSVPSSGCDSKAARHRLRGRAGVAGGERGWRVLDGAARGQVGGHKQAWCRKAACPAASLGPHPTAPPTAHLSAASFSPSSMQCVVSSATGSTRRTQEAHCPASPLGAPHCSSRAADSSLSSGPRGGAPCCPSVSIAPPPPPSAAAACCCCCCCCLRSSRCARGTAAWSASAMASTLWSAGRQGGVVGWEASRGKQRRTAAL